MVFILLGPPGVGKGTQASQLIDSFGGEHISTGDLLREACRNQTGLGLKAQKYMNDGDLVPDSLILDLIRDHLGSIDPKAKILFDGFPRTIPQADGLDDVLLNVSRRVDKVVLFEAPEHELIKRLSGRRSCANCGTIFNVYFSPPKIEDECERCGEVLVHRSDDNPDTVRHRLRVYQSQTAQLVEHYSSHSAVLKRVSAMHSVDEVQSAFRAAIGMD